MSQSFHANYTEYPVSKVLDEIFKLKAPAIRALQMGVVLSKYNPHLQGANPGALN